MKDMTHLLLDVTHDCNLNCGFCIKGVQRSSYQITYNQLEAVCEHCNNLPLEFIRISGGEPLTHPAIHIIVNTLLTRMKKPIDMNTNGLLLPTMEHIIPTIQLISITRYKGVNEHIIDRYAHLDNVNVIEREYWYDPNLDPNFTIRQARKAHERCVLRQINVTGSRVYGCCMGEVIERRYKTTPIHVGLGPRWEGHYQDLDITPGCQHCCIAAKEGWAK